jgi:hypothetical protein
VLEERKLSDKRKNLPVILVVEECTFESRCGHTCRKLFRKIRKMKVTVTVKSERRVKKLHGLEKTATWKSIAQKGEGGCDLDARSRQQQQQQQQQQHTLLNNVLNGEATLGD